MAAPLGTIRTLRSALANDLTTPTRLAETALANANRNPGRNTYLWRDPAWTKREAERAEQMPRGEGGPFGDGRPIFWGLPVSVKDCFDLAGAPTTCGTTFYRDSKGIATRDSWIVERLRALGAVITGKTHLHPLAYGITGENPEFGDCLQPGKERALTGGSSSGACASVMEGSAVAAIGTDTGGSVRVPAALCGLAGYRASLGRGDWRGGAHLAQSFDTLGWLFADLEEAPLLGSFFSEREPAHIRAYGKFAVAGEDILNDCESAILHSYRKEIAELEGLGLQATTIDIPWWSEAQDIFARIQAWEASGLHRGNFDRFETAIRERLEWGARITPDEIAMLRQRHEQFKVRIDDLFEEHQLVMPPAAPVAQLAAGADHSNTRKRLLRYTAAISLAGAPAVTIPCSVGGMQLAAARHQDEALLQLVALLGARRKASPPVLNS
ncbi:MAG TPA: amidase [Terracidiphilus sp.]|jgi:aspartyl-tRNA(Asn)/glutamyl-tRNA(Gln) amidotransferase subunit A|nr:amidase [Terracidiphilus sp.]